MEHVHDKAPPRKRKRNFIRKKLSGSSKSPKRAHTGSMSSLPKKEEGGIAQSAPNSPPRSSVGSGW
eukprot:16443450-Heterocapsa_arctica.AAC.1